MTLGNSTRVGRPVRRLLAPFASPFMLGFCRSPLMQIVLLNAK